jgi:hypothetical protein
MATNLLKAYPSELELLQVGSALLGDDWPTSGLDNSACEEGHSLSSVASSGKVVSLGDGSVWQVAVVGWIDTVLWLSIEPIILCGSEMINTANGDRVSVTRLR